MYREFYGLKEKPFNLTPSPRFLYLGESHKEALALLTYGVVERKGFILLTGEVGTGKTTMVQALLANLDESVQHISLYNPILSPNDFMNYLAFSAFKKKVHFKSKAAFLLEFEDFLRQCLQHQKNFILIIDEAHKLSFELLEEIRLLSNMESADEKLINIFLIGQPELNEKLSEPRCRPLLQRISSRYHIPPLDFKDTRNYMDSRLKIAGAKSVDDIFSKSALKAVYHYSGGYPRMINILADNSMLLGYSKEKRNISPAMVKQSYDDMNLSDSFLKRGKEITEPSKTQKVEPIYLGRYWKWAAIFFIMFIMIAIVVVGMSQRGQDFLRQFSQSIKVNGQAPIQKVEEAPVLVKKKQAPAKKEKDPGDKRISSGNKDALNSVQMEGQVFPEVQEEVEETESSRIIHPGYSEDKVNIIPEEYEDVAPSKSIIVKEGDTLARLAIDVYGEASENTLGLIQKNNPEIKNINLIGVGQEIIFPALPLSKKGSTFSVHVASFKPFEHARHMFQKLLKLGYDAYIIPAYNAQKGKIFRVTIGNFEGYNEARDYAATILKEGVSDYARPIRLEMR